MNWARNGVDLNMRKKFALIALASLVLSGCGDMINGKSVAESQVAVFHGRLNAKQFDEIYTAAGADFRKTGGKDKKVNLFAAINRKLGAAKSSNLVSWNVMTDNFKTKAVLVEETKFEHGKGTETFTFSVAGEKAELVDYNINSTDMMMK
jgi:hypothetical protein